MPYFQLTAANNSDQLQTWAIQGSGNIQVPAHGAVQSDPLDVNTPQSFGINVEQGENFAGVRLDLTGGGAVLYPMGNPFALTVVGAGSEASPYLVTVTCASLDDDESISGPRPRLFG